MLFCMASLLSLGARADIVGGIDVPKKIGAFELQKLIDNETEKPGLGKTLVFYHPEVVATAYVYNAGLTSIPNSIDAQVVLKQFNQARGDVLKLYPTAKLTYAHLIEEVQGYRVLHADFIIPDSTSNRSAIKNSELYLTTCRGNFVKIRTTYYDGESGAKRDQIKAEFIEAFFKLLRPLVRNG